MNLNRISNLRKPVDSDEVATKSYCDNRATKIYNKYIPVMTSFAGRMNEKMGFRATASSERNSNYTADNPFNGFYSEGHGAGGEWATLRETATFGFKLKYRISFEYGELIYEVETAAQVKYTIGNSSDLRTVKII